MSTTVLHEGRFVRLVNRDGYEFAQRTHARGVVVILAVTDDDRLILIEQPRPPVGGSVIELPAGLAGDIAGAESEPLEEAARRELLEETGYTCKELRKLTEAPPSPGMISEVYTVFLATGLTRVAQGGGDHTESITVFEVPLFDVGPWLSHAERRGARVAMTVYGGLGLLALNRQAGVAL